MSNQQRKWLNNSNSGGGGSGFGKSNNNSNSGSNSGIGGYYNGDSPFSSYSSQSASPINMMGKSIDTNSINNNSFVKLNTGNSSSSNSHTPQIGSFTQNYELYSMNKLFSINSSQQQAQTQQQQKDSKDTSNQFINRDNSRDGGNPLKRSTSSASSNTGTGQKSLSDHFLSTQSSRDDHHFNKYGVHPQGSSHHQQQQQQTPQATSILLLAQCGSDDHTFTAMYCSNDYLIFRYVGQSIVPFYKCLKWDKDPSKKIVSMCFDPSAIWLLCLLNDTSCKVIPIYYDMCKKVGFIDDNNSKPMVNHRPPPEKTDRLSNWVSTSRLFKLSSSNIHNKDNGKDSGSGSQNNLNNLTSANSTSGGSGFSKFKIPQLTKKTALGSNCLWWKTSNSVDYAIITTTSNNIYFVNLVDNSVYKHRFEYSIEKIEMVQSDSETFLLIATRSNGYYQLLIEQKIDHHKYETIIQLGNQPSNSKSSSSSSDSHSNVSRSSDFNIKTLFQTDRNPSDRVLLVQKTNINQHVTTSTNSPSSTQSPTSPTVSSSPTSPQPINGLLSSSSSSINSNNSNNNNNNNGSNENVVVSFLRSTSKLEIYEPLYLNKYPLFVYQLPANTTNFFFTKHITIVSEVITTLSNGNEAIQTSNVSILSNLVAGTASNSKFINNQSIMQTFQLAPGETILGISKSLNHHHSNSNSNNNNSNNNNTSYNFNNNNHNNNIFNNNEEELMKYTKIPTVSLWTNFAIYELRQKKSPEEIFFELVSCNLEKSDGEALGKTFGLDLLSCYEAAADIKFDQGQYGRALDLYYLSGVRTNKLVFKFLEIGRMDIIMTHLKAILHQPDSFNVLDRKKISDLLFQCYLYKLLSSKDDFKSLEAEFYHFLSSNQDYADIKALLLLSSNGLLDYFFSVAHSRRIMPTALQMLIESDILHLDAQNISFLQSAYSHELKSHANGMIFDCLPPKLQVKLIIDDQQTIPRYLRRLYHIIPLLDEKELLDIAETFDPLVFTPPGTINQKLVKSNQFSHSNQNNYYHNLHHQHQQQQQHYQQQQYHQQHHQYNNNILSLEDAEFENNSTPGRQSESIPIKDEEYFELYLITLLTLIYKRNQKDGSGSNSSNNGGVGIGSGRHRSHRHNESKKQQQVKLEIPDNESTTTTTTNTNSDDENSSNTSSSKNGGNSSGKKSTIRLKPDPELMIHPMQMLKNEKRALKVSCGWDHVVVIGEDGDVYTWGNNTYGQCGHGLEIGKMQTTPKRLEFFRGKSPIIMAECGGDHTIAVDSNYTVYSWGSDKFGQLGHGTKSVSLTRPKIIEELSGQKIQAIAAGYAHTIVLKKSGELFSFGYGEMGQLGHGSYSSKSVPTRIEINTIVGPQHHSGGKITLIACGYAHSVFCTDNGEVYTWGYGKKGQLGHGSFENISRPRLVDALKGVTKISCGHFYTIATTDLKNVYSWGAGEHMKLGHGQDKNEAIPRVVDFFIQKNVSKIVCGLNHTITLTYPNLNNSNSNDHESDDDQDFNDGKDDDPDFNGFTHIGNGKSGRSINNSNSSSGGIGESSPIYAWGEGEHGKLGLGGDLKSPFFDKPIPTAIKGVNALNLMDISCGSDFTAMITTNGAVYVWGFGRFGQIGNGKNEDAWVPIRIPLTDSKSNGLGGGAGGIAADNKKQRYSLDGLEDTLRNHIACYRPFYILNKAKQFENYDIAAVIYDILNDHLSTLEYRLLSLEKKCLDKDKELPLIFNMLSNYFIKDLDGPPLQQSTLSTSTSSTSLNTLQTSGTNTPILSSSSSSSSSPSPSLNSSKGIDQSNSINNSIDQSATTLVQDEKLLKFNLITMIFNYYKKKDLPITDLEGYLSTNIEHFSELLSSVIQFNSHLELPLILNFTPLFYINTLKNYLQTMKNQSEIEKSKQKVSEKILWQNINENLEKNLLQRSKIEIPTLNQDIYSSLNSNGLNNGGGSIHTEKDIAFTCNHFFSKRTFYGSTLPDFQSEIQKLSIPSQLTLDYIIQEYNKKSISQSCPICLFNSIRDIQNIDETRKDILKLFKLS